jgi:hypothetical protein
LSVFRGQLADGGSLPKATWLDPTGPGPALRCGLLIPDDQAERIDAGLATAERETLARWVQALLADRRARSSLLLGQTRRVAFARKRLAQAATYLDGLLAKAEDEAQAAWPGKLPCPRCGAPVAMVRAEQRAIGHAVVHEHPDGVRCEGAIG